MVFSSPVFLFVFLTSVYVLYRIIPSITAKNLLLLIFSLAFYTYGEPKALILMLISIEMNYWFGRAMKQENNYRKPVLVCAVTANLLMLGFQICRLRNRNAEQIAFPQYFSAEYSTSHRYILLYISGDVICY